MNQVTGIVDQLALQKKITFQKWRTLKGGGGGTGDVVNITYSFARPHGSSINAEGNKTAAYLALDR